MSEAIVSLTPLTRTDLAVVTPWFEDPDTRRSLGGPQWPAAMLAHAKQSIGTTFRGARQTGAYHYLALAAAVELFEAGVEPENHASRGALEAAGFRLQSPIPDCEEMLYYRAPRVRIRPNPTGTPSLMP